MSRRVDPPRRAAYDLLRAVESRDAYANLVLPGMLRERGISGRDAAFATELAYSTLRSRGTYDALLAACVDRPLDRVDPEVLDLLRLGAHQLLGMRVPAHAAVSATVDLARSTVGPARAAFVNAVLRKVAADDLDGWMLRVAPPAQSDPIGHLAVTTSHPGWVVQAFQDALGPRADELPELLAADNVRPGVTLVARPGLSTVTELVGLGGERGRWSPYAVHWPGGDPADLDPVVSGRAGVQDEASQLVALAVAAVPARGPDTAWLDMCAGPGGKAALLAALAAGRGAALVAADVQPHRARLARDVLGAPRGELSPPVAAPASVAIVADGTAGPWRPGTFDRVLVDAPCTGLGALRRRPEARWRRRPSDVPRLTALQRRLLEAAIDATRAGGVIAYVTCSPHLAETDAVTSDVGSRRGDVEQVDAREFLAEVSVDDLAEAGLGSGPAARLWPHRHGTDGMYLALFRRL
jgi:16S rRNA (cytosine967-C5)-methyltransferase